MVLAPYGVDRVVSPLGVFPQAAQKLDPSLPIRDNEILIRVEKINVDSASFHELLSSTPGQNPEHLKKRILDIVQKRGKLHNPVTNSGGMLIGTVAEVGSQAVRRGFQVGERVATLVSLTLTPLHLESIDEIDLKTEQLKVKGHAILFESGMAHRLPHDMPESVALALFDVCGAPALVSHWAHLGETLVIFGAGKAGLLVAAEARKKSGRQGKIIVLERDEKNVKEADEMPFIDQVHQADLTEPLKTYQTVSRLTEARLADLVVNCVNVPGTEMASILAAKKNGTVLFFNMATNFQAAVLGAEGIGHETRLVMGNGYYPGHAELALNLLRSQPTLRAWFERRFSKGS